MCEGLSSSNKRRFYPIVTDVCTSGQISFMLPKGILATGGFKRDEEQITYETRVMSSWMAIYYLKIA
jgi:hypothetical protein